MPISKKIHDTVQIQLVCSIVRELADYPALFGGMFGKKSVVAFPKKQGLSLVASFLCVKESYHEGATE